MEIDEMINKKRWGQYEPTSIHEQYDEIMKGNATKSAEEYKALLEKIWEDLDCSDDVPNMWSTGSGFIDEPHYLVPVESIGNMGGLESYEYEFTDDGNYAIIYLDRINKEGGCMGAGTSGASNARYSDKPVKTKKYGKTHIYHEGLNFYNTDKPTREDYHKLAEEVNAYIRSKGCQVFGDMWYLSEVPEENDWGACYLADIEGDWKHGHLWFEELTREFLEQKGIAYDVHERWSEDNGTDFFRAEHAMNIPDRTIAWEVDLGKSKTEKGYRIINRFKPRNDWTFYHKDGYAVEDENEATVFDSLELAIKIANKLREKHPDEIRVIDSEGYDAQTFENVLFKGKEDFFNSNHFLIAVRHVNGIDYSYLSPDGDLVEQPMYAMMFDDSSKASRLVDDLMRDNPMYSFVVVTDTGYDMTGTKVIYKADTEKSRLESDYPDNRDGEYVVHRTVNFECMYPRHFDSPDEFNEYVQELIQSGWKGKVEGKHAYFERND